MLLVMILAKDLRMPQFQATIRSNGLKNTKKEIRSNSSYFKAHIQSISEKKNPPIAKSPKLS